MSLIKYTHVKSGSGSASHFSQTMKIPAPSEKDNVVVVKVMDAHTPMDIELLPRTEDPLVMMMEASPLPDLPIQITHQAFVSMNTGNFILSTPDEEMWKSGLSPLNLNDPRVATVFNQPLDGERWYHTLKDYYFTHEKYLKTNMMTTELLKAEEDMAKQNQVGWWDYVNEHLGPVFMSRKENPEPKRSFFKWLWRKDFQMLNKDIEIELGTNVPISPEMVCRNNTDLFLRFTVPKYSLKNHSLASLFSTLPNPIGPMEKAYSTGANFLPKDLYTHLIIHSNLCNRDSITGREATDVLHRLSTGNQNIGFKRADSTEYLPLALNPGYQQVDFTVKGEGTLPVTYANPTSGETSLTLLFFEISP